MQLLSKYENIELAEHMLSEIGATANLEQETVYWVGMAMREAMANAIKHGNKLNPEKRIHVQMRLSDSELTISVEDEGDGFNPEQLPDPTDPENLLRSSGRGVFYMKHFMDEVRFEKGKQGGTRIELVKRVGKKRRAQ